MLVSGLPISKLTVRALSNFFSLRLKANSSFFPLFSFEGWAATVYVARYSLFTLICKVTTVTLVL